MEDFKVYYKLIMSPHRPYVRDMLEKIKNLDISMIAPSHGYVLRSNPEKFIQLYDEMSDLSEQKQPRKVTIVYTTMTGNTTKVAQKLAEGLGESGVETSVFNLKNADLAEVKKRVMESDGLLVGSPTKYADMVGNVEELLKMLKSDDGRNRFATAFGSYGWSGEAIMHIEDYLNKAGFTVVNQNYLIGNLGVDMPLFPVRVKFARDENLQIAEKAGRFFGEQVLAQ